MRYFYLIVVSIFFLSCESSFETPEDFSIKIKHFGESYDSKSGNYTRSYNFKKKTVKIFLSPEQKLQLYKTYKNINVLSFPTEFECDTLKPGGVIPSFSFEIEVTANRITKSSGTSNYCDHKIDMVNEKKLKSFFNEITKIIENSKSYKTLPPSDRIML